MSQQMRQAGGTRMCFEPQGPAICFKGGRTKLRCSVRGMVSGKSLPLGAWVSEAGVFSQGYGEWEG